MELLQKKLTLMAEEDGVTVDDFLTFAKSVYEKVVSYAPCGRFQVLLPKTGYRHPCGVCVEPPYADHKGIELVYQLRDCVPGWKTVTLYNFEGSNPQTLGIRCKR